jgi:hypothetical protein
MAEIDPVLSRVDEAEQSSSTQALGSAFEQAMCFSLML